MLFCGLSKRIFSPHLRFFAAVETIDGLNYQDGSRGSRRSDRQLQWPGACLATVRLGDTLTYKTAEWLLLQVADQQAVYVIGFEA